MTWSAKLASWPSVADAGRAVDFYKSAFGAVEPERLEVLHGGVNHRRIDGKDEVAGSIPAGGSTD
jgi:uncharacterized glyoxalase superfamily protein PhnB